MLFYLLLRELCANLVERFDGLQSMLARPILLLSHLCVTLSLTSGSSMAARFSRGERSTWPCCGPPTYSTKLPSSSLSAVRTSSSSSTDSIAVLSAFCTARKDNHESNLKVLYTTYHRERVSTLHVCDQDQVRGQWSTAGVWH